MADVYSADPNAGSIGPDMEYVTSLDSICKIIEMVLSMCLFICACVWGTYSGGGWVQFVGIFCFLVIGIFYTLKFLRIVYKLPEVIPVPLIELITCAVFVLFNLIAGIVAAATYKFPAIQASAAFGFFCVFAYGADTFLKFQTWRGEGGTLPFGQGASSGNTTTTTSSTTVTMSNEEPKY